MRHTVLRLATIASVALGPLVFGLDDYCHDLDERVFDQPKAIEVRLIGECNGKYYAAMEEDQFPATGCKWIEGIRVEGE